MKYQEFKNLIDKPFFRKTDVDFKLTKVSSVQLSRWHKMGYIYQIKRGLYSFDDRLSSQLISFLLYEPSYMSVESALSYYGLIPEMVPVTTAISTKKTRRFENQYGVFTYRHVNPKLFFGYVPVDDVFGKYLLAEPEKAILDYIYFNQSRLLCAEDIEGIRLDIVEFSKTINVNKLNKYAMLFHSNNINKILLLLMTYVNANK
jgi:hypothetical protein